MWQYNSNSNYLAHYGVLGMKWGQHRLARNNPTVKALRKQKKADNKNYIKKTNEMTRLRFNKKKQKKADDEAYKAFNKSVASDKKYKKAYKKAYKEAGSDLHKKLGYDKKTSDRVANMSKGKAILQSSVMSSYGALKYNEAKAHGVSTGKALTKGIMSSWGDNLTMGRLSSKDGMDTFLKNKAK